MKRMMSILHLKEWKALSPQGNKQYDVILFPWAHGALELPVNPSSVLFLCLSLTSLSKLIFTLPSRSMGKPVSSRELLKTKDVLLLSHVLKLLKLSDKGRH